MDRQDLLAPRDQQVALAQPAQEDQLDQLDKEGKVDYPDHLDQQDLPAPVEIEVDPVSMDNLDAQEQQALVDDLVAPDPVAHQDHKDALGSLDQLDLLGPQDLWAPAVPLAQLDRSGHPAPQDHVAALDQPVEADQGEKQAHLEEQAH